MGLFFVTFHEILKNNGSLAENSQRGTLVEKSQSTAAYWIVSSDTVLCHNAGHILKIDAQKFSKGQWWNTRG